MFLVVLSLCVASCLAEPSIGYSYSAYAPLSHGYPQYSPYYAKSAYPYGYPFYYNQPHSVISAPHAPLDLKSQYHTADVYGHTTYGHSEPQQAHHAVQDVHGNKVGSYSYVKPDGHIHQTSYVADADGYRVTSNDLPVGPAPHVSHVAPVAPVVPIVAHLGVPAVPAETPEVIAAKEAHFAAHAKALAAHAHSLHKRSIYSYAGPVVHPNGYLSDTPEVSAAKAAHFAEHAKRGNYYVAPYAAYNSGAYYTPYSHTPAVTADGYLADTPEVAAAKAAHLAEKAKVSYSSVPVAYGASHPVVGADGHVLDTPEVAAAKSAHYAEYAAAAARSAAPAPLAYHGSHYSPLYTAHTPSYVAHSPSYAAHSPSYYAAPPVVLPDGHLADTPDVAHAKAAHFAEYAKVASRQKRSLLPSVYSLHPAVAPAHSYSALPFYPYARPVTHTAIVHGPHAVSYVHQA